MRTNDSESLLIQEASSTVTDTTTSQQVFDGTLKSVSTDSE